jgi:hypothetical protein
MYIKHAVIVIVAFLSLTAALAAVSGVTAAMVETTRDDYRQRIMSINT